MESDDGCRQENNGHGPPFLARCSDFREYLEAWSPRRQQVQDYKQEQEIDVVAAAADRRPSHPRPLLWPEEVQRQHRVAVATMIALLHLVYRLPLQPHHLRGPCNVRRSRAARR